MLMFRMLVNQVMKLIQINKKKIVHKIRLRLKYQ
jgi:hypothetical protein